MQIDRTQNSLAALSNKMEVVLKKVPPTTLQKFALGKDVGRQLKIATELLGLIRDSAHFREKLSATQTTQLDLLALSVTTNLARGVEQEVRPGFFERLFGRQEARAQKTMAIRNQIVIIRRELGQLFEGPTPSASEIGAGTATLSELATRLMHAKGSETLNKYDVARHINQMLPRSLRLSPPRPMDTLFLKNVAAVLRTALPSELKNPDLRNLQLFFKHHEIHSFVRTYEGGLFMQMNTPSQHEIELYQLKVSLGTNAKGEARTQVRQGRFGLIRWAMDMRSGAICAVRKVDSTNFEMALEECRLHAKLAGCDHIMCHQGSVLPPGKGKLYIMMPLCQGLDASDAIKRINGSALARSEKDALLKYFAKQAFCGISEAHSRGIAHLDIKPENMLVRPNGHVDIIDFGRATEIDYLHRSGYANPTLADSFSLGATLYKMLAPPDAPPLVDLDKHNHRIAVLDNDRAARIYRFVDDRAAADLICDLTAGQRKPVTVTDSLAHGYFSGTLSDDEAQALLERL